MPKTRKMEWKGYSMIRQKGATKTSDSVAVITETGTKMVSTSRFKKLVSFFAPYGENLACRNCGLDFHLENTDSGKCPNCNTEI